MADSRLSTRRALLKLGTGAAAYGAGATLVSVAGIATTAHFTPAHGATMPTDPMEGFARAWLETWTAEGGSFAQHIAGQWSAGFPEYHTSPTYKRDRAKLEAGEYFRSLDPNIPADRGVRETIERQQVAFNDARYMGRMHGLLDVLKAVPGGKDAVKALLARQPGLGWPTQQEG